MPHTPPHTPLSTESLEPSGSGATGPALSPEGYDPQSTERVKVTGRLRRLLVWYGLASFGVYVCIGAVNAVLLPLQIEQLDPERKAANLALAAALGAVAGMLAQPIAGLLSDRTRSQRGSRAPWIISGAIGAAVALIVLGGLSGLLGIVIVYVMLNVALNLYLGPKAAIMPDRVPRGVRGLFSAVSGLGILFGVLGGQALGSGLAAAPFAGYCTLAVMIVLAGFGLVRFNPDHDNRGEPREPLHWSMLLRTFWVNPRQHPDFAYGFIGRLMTLMGFYLVNTFQLFLLQDYVGLGDDAVRRASPARAHRIGCHVGQHRPRRSVQRPNRPPQAGCGGRWAADRRIARRPLADADRDWVSHLRPRRRLRLRGLPRGRPGTADRGAAHDG